MSDYIKRSEIGIGKCNSEIFENHAYADGWNAAVEIIENTPAADVRENVHAHWAMLSFDEAVCTACSYNRNTHFYNTEEAKELWDELPPFCEMCGAIMDGGDKRERK